MFRIFWRDLLKARSSLETGATPTPWRSEAMSRLAATLLRAQWNILTRWRTSVRSMPGLELTSLRPSLSTAEMLEPQRVVSSRYEMMR